jgi:hypothetical protein
MGRPMKAVIIVAGFFLLFTVAGFFVLPPVLKSVLVNKLSQTLHRQVSINRIKLNPYTLCVQVKGLTVKDRDSKNVFVSWDELFFNLDINSVFRGTLILREMKITKPYISVVRNTGNTYNFSDLLIEKKDGKAEAKSSKKTGPFLFSINNIVITGGQIDFFDGPKNILHNVKDMNLSVPFISNVSYAVETIVQPAFSADINGDIYSFTGKTKPFAQAREAYIDINIEDLDIPKYLAYIPLKLNFNIVSCAIDLKGRLSFLEHKDKKASLNFEGNMTARKVNLDDLQKKPLLRMPSLEIGIVSIDPFVPAVHLSSAVASSPEVVVKRDKTGGVNLSALISKIPDNTKSSDIKKSLKIASGKAEEEPLPKIDIDELRIKDGSIVFQDFTPDEPVSFHISDLMVAGEKISTQKNSISPITLTMLINKKSTISTRGSIGINPIMADLALDVKKIAIPVFQSYFTDAININVTEGSINMSGKLNVVDIGKTAPGAKFTGSVLVSGFSAIDKAGGNDFLKWKALSFGSLIAGYNPVYAHIGNISIADFYARVAVNSDGTLNLQHITNEKKASGDTETSLPDTEQSGIKPSLVPKTRVSGEPVEDGKEQIRNITVGTVTLQGGTIDFTDKMIQPVYSASLNEIGGRVTGLSLNGDKNADVELRGKVNQYVPLTIAGKINPKRDDLLVDLTAKFNDLDLSPITPYSGKYMGYKIEKGKLSIDLKYLIVKKKLNSENLIFIDQLTLGDKTDSPSATNLPLRLAIALLKDRNGQIKLDIPVSGSIDDPEFSVFRIVIKIIVNLITKAATAPFALLGALFGGGEELSYLEFDYGKPQLTDTNIKKIDTLVKALFERPGLKLDIEGHADPEKDKEAIRTYLFKKKIKVQKLNTLIRKGQTAVPVDDVVIDPKEYEQYLTMAYKAEKFEKPRNMLGFMKSLPVPEMEKLMLTHLVVNDEDLRSLAVERAARVRDTILGSGKINADRVFVVEPKTIAPERKEKIKESRVDFKLK